MQDSSNSSSSLALSCTYKMVQGVLQEEHEWLPVLDVIGPIDSGTVIDSKYRILSLLGEGGMGMVYRAQHLTLGIEVALKTFRSPDLSREKWMRFQREAQAIARLENINIVRVFDFGIAEGSQPYYTMELLSGETLAQRISRQGAVLLPAALIIFKAVAEGLVSAHSSGIVHRDLKPANIFLVMKGEQLAAVKLVDFGIAKLAGAGGEDAQRLTAAGTIFGSPLYMSPEQSLGEDTDGRSDIYSYACALYEALTGRPPFVGKNAFDTVCRHQSVLPRKLADMSPDRSFPPWIESLISRMLAKEKEKRVQSFQEVLDVFSFYNKSDKSNGSKSAPQSRQRPGLKDVAGQVSDRRVYTQSGPIALPSSWRSVILVASVTALLMTAACCIFLSGRRPGLVRPSVPNQAAQPVQQAAHSKAAPVANSKGTVRFFQFMEQASTGPYKVFKFPSRWPIGCFVTGEGSASSCIECMGEVRIPANDMWTFEPNAFLFGQGFYFDGFTSDDLTAICFDPRMLTGYNWSDAHLHALTHMPGLKRLSVRNTEVSGAAAPDIGQLKNLNWLDVSQSRITGQDLVKLPNLYGLNELIAARIEGMPEFLKLADKGKLKLATISMHQTGLTDHDLAEVAKIQTLQSLNLDDNRITVAGIKHLAKLPQIHILMLSGTDVGPEAIDTIGQIKTLTHIILPFPPCGLADRARLQSLLPGCRVDLQVSSKH